MEMWALHHVHFSDYLMWIPNCFPNSKGTRPHLSAQKDINRVDKI